MKKFISCLLAALLCCGCLLTPCLAESYTGSEDLQVTLTADGTIVSNLGETNEAPHALQPGDDVTYTVAIVNRNSRQAEWYMKNQILHSLEDRSAVASGGAYTYRLTYRAADGTETVLFDSDTVGGTGEHPAGEGLHEAGSALSDYFYFAALEPGRSGTVTLYVALDGESQGNAYQDTLADLQMNFAVAVVGDASVTVVHTGDDTRLFPLFVAMGASGLALLGILAVTLLRRRKQRKGGDPA